MLVLLKVSKLWGLMNLFAGKGGEEDDYEHHYLTACTSSSCRESWVPLTIVKGGASQGDVQRTAERACSSLERAAKTLKGPKARDQPA